MTNNNMNKVNRIIMPIKIVEGEEQSSNNPSKIIRFYSYLLFIWISLMNLSVFAEFKRAHSMLSKVQTGLTGLSLVTVTIAVLWVGYKVLFGGCTLRECAPIIIGAVLIASASEFAKLLVG